MSEQAVAIAALVMCMGGAFALFGFLAVASWADARRREREAFYRSETLKKIAETETEGANSAIELIREQERSAAKARREGQKLAGLITLSVGAGLMVFLRTVQHDQPAYMAGVIPLLIGAALMIYAYVLAPKE